MPRSTNAFSTYVPRRTMFFGEGNNILLTNTAQPMTSAQFRPFGMTPPGIKPPTPIPSPQEVSVSLDDIEDVEEAKKRNAIWWKILLVLLAILIIGAAIGVPIALLLGKATADGITVTTTTATTATTATATTATTATTTSATTTSATTTTTSSTTTTSDTTITTTTTETTTTETTTATETTTTETTTATETTTTETTETTTTETTETTTTETTTTTQIACVYPYMITSNDTCVNILIDFDNCGSVGYVCASSYVSCSAGICSSAPTVQLDNSTYVWTASINGSVDDNYFGVNLPFNVTLYTTTTDYIYVSSNGVLCLGLCSGAYTESSLPTGTFPDATIFGYWDDLFIYSGTSQGIYKAVEGASPNRTLIFEYYTSHFGASNEYYHYQILLFEGLPGIVQIIYFDASDSGVSCTIGVQASGSGPSMEYSYDVAGSVTQNMTLIFDTNTGTFTNTLLG